MHKFYWLHPDIEVRQTNTYGNGLFARRKIKKDCRLLVIGGYVLSLFEESMLPGKCSDNGVQISEDLVLSITKEEEYGGFNYLNHSCEPTAGFKGQIFIVARRNIKPNEQITIDYAMVLCANKTAPSYEMTCLCGTKNCRKIITDTDWKRKDLQKKYRGYFQLFLEEKITKKKI